MRQEISVSYLAIKCKVYRLIDALVAGEKTEEEIQESVRRWWDHIAPVDRPVAKKYLLTVLGRSVTALDAIGDGFVSSNGCETERDLVPSERIRVMERLLKADSVPSTV